MDECQWQVSPDLVDIYEFDSEDEAKAFNLEGKILSNVRKVGDKFVRGWSIVGQVFAETMEEAGEYYNFRVKLAADYDIGTDWSETH